LKWYHACKDILTANKRKGTLISIPLAPHSKVKMVFSLIILGRKSYVIKQALANEYSFGVH